MKDLLYYYPAVITCDKGAFGGHLFETLITKHFLLALCWLTVI